MRSFKRARVHRDLFFSCTLIAVACVAASTARAQARTQVPARGGPVEIKADHLKGRQGDIVIYEGNVLVHSQDQQLRADHVDYNQVTQDVTARGHVVFDHGDEHLEADDALYNLNTLRGTFHHVHGTIKSKSRPNVQVLITSNPLTFAADEVERIDERTYKVRRGNFTVCTPDKPTWKFYAPYATVHLDQKVALLNANFRLYRIPLIWLPYSTLPDGKNARQSGFLIPAIGESNLKGTILGDAFYWAPNSWFDATAGGEFMSRRGWSQTDEVRATPWDNVSLTANFFGVEDRGLPGPNGVLVPQGGNETKVLFSALLPGGWRAVADVDKLSSLTFRLAFSPTFGEAVNAEANTSLFLSNNFHGFSLNFAALDDKDFLTETPQTAVSIRNMPSVDFGSVDQAPWQRVPVYFGFDASAGGMYRSDPDITTPAIVQRSEFAPRVTVPLHWGPWLGLTSSFTFRTTYYGAQLQDGSVVGDPFVRNTGEFTLDVRLPSFERIWKSASGTKWKHAIEPDLVYRYVTGVNDFGRFIRFDDDETLTDTNELEYGVTNRLFRRKKDGTAQEFLTWRVVQKYYFDPTFGGAIVSGQPNVFEALDSISPFAIAMGPIQYSPLVSDLTISPGGTYDGELRLEYDTQQHRFVSAGTLFKMHPVQKLTLTLADFDINADPLLQQRSNQVRTLVGYGDQTSKGWNFTGGFSYDIEQRFVQNEIAQVGYNGNCCGIQLEYRKIELGSVRNEGQFRVALVIANIGSFGNVRKPDKIF
jgi:LPS-assembly protein